MISEPIKSEILKLFEKDRSGYYVFIKNKFIENIRNFKSTFSSSGNNLKLAYSIKANYHPDLIKIASNEHLCFDCASLMELNFLLTNGIPANKIWVNTPFLNHELLDLCIKNEILINVDSLEQLIEIENAASAQNKKVEIGIRFNLSELEASRFGIETDDERMLKLMSVLNSSKNIDVKVLHIHYSTPSRDAISYAERAEQLFALYLQWFKNFNITTINIGGGLFGPVDIDFAKQFENVPPTWNDYASYLQDFIKKLKDANLSLAIEPGMALVADTFYFLAEVISLKNSRQLNFAMLNTSKLFLKPTGHSKQISFEVINSENTKKDESLNYNLVGITCMENDLVGQYFGTLAKGDLIIFKNVGAYTASYRPNFIFAAPETKTI